CGHSFLHPSHTPLALGVGAFLGLLRGRVVPSALAPLRFHERVELFRRGFPAAVVGLRDHTVEVGGGVCRQFPGVLQNGQSPPTPPPTLSPRRLARGKGGRARLKAFSAPPTAGGGPPRADPPPKTGGGPSSPRRDGHPLRCGTLHAGASVIALRDVPAVHGRE